MKPAEREPLQPFEGGFHDAEIISKSIARDGTNYSVKFCWQSDASSRTVKSSLPAARRM
jgi:hypothetical protein